MMIVPIDTAMMRVMKSAKKKVLTAEPARALFYLSLKLELPKPELPLELKLILFEFDEEVLLFQLIYELEVF